MRTMCRTRRRRTRPPRTLSPRTREPPWTGRRPPRGRGETMLSRIADAMFWIGRYVERADQTARILDVKLQSITEDAAQDVPLPSKGGSGSSGIRTAAERDLPVRRLLNRLATNPANPPPAAAARQPGGGTPRAAREG